MENKICIVTYTHTNCKDLWAPYKSRLKKHAGMYPAFMLTNESTGDESDFVYDENDPFSVQWIKCLRKLKTMGFDYFIYSQEDFILYGDINVGSIDMAINEIKYGKTDFVKLIKSGGVEYCMQSAVHDIDKFLAFYEKYQIDSIRQEGFLSQCCVGEYESKFSPMAWVGEKRGLFHYDSKVWPYIATALNKGKWNTSEYKKELTYFQQEYMVDFTDRGTL